jgi:tetratricopeptide (TPR) repeat protein
LIFWLSLRLKFSLRVSAIAALLFAIHPMHVVSVATVSERKDALYAPLYLLAMHQYLTFSETKKIRPYLFSLFFCLLSMLAKPMALSLPFALLLLDFIHARKLDLKCLADKVPFFLIIVPLAWVTYTFHMRVPFNPTEGPLIWIWSFVFYPVKFLFPAVLTPLYTLPEPISILNPHFLLAIALFAAAILAVFFFRKNRLWIFASGFYTISIFYLLRFNAAGDTPVVADQYMYLASLGFCIFIGFHVDRFMARSSKVRAITVAATLLVFSLLAAKTFQQCSVWKNDLSFLSAIERDNPNYRMVHNLLGHYYIQRGQPELAIGQFNMALGYKKEYDYWIYGNIGIAYVGMGKMNEAIKAYDRSLAMNSECPETYMNRATVYDETGQYDLAFSDYSSAIKYNPQFAQAYHNRAILYYRKGEFKRAAQDLMRAIEIIPDFLTAYYFRSQIYAVMGERDKALSDLDMVLKLKPGYAAAEPKRAALLKSTGPLHTTLDIPPDTFTQGPWKGDQYKNYLSDKDYIYQL